MIYKIQPALVNKNVGYTVSERMNEGYQYDSINSIYNLNIRGKLKFTPDINAIEILKRGKPMDIINSVPMGNSGIIISNRLKKIFLNHTLQIETQIFDAYAVYIDKEYEYNYFYIYKSYEDRYIDWKLSEFTKTTILGIESIGGHFNLSLKRKIEMGLNSEYIKPKKLVINKNEINSDIIRLDYSYSGYFVSEKVKKEIEISNCQGVDLIPIDQLGFKVEFI